MAMAGAAITAGDALLATLRGESFGIGASEGARGADAAALVMLALFAVLFTLIVLVARGFAKRAANPLPEQVLMDEVDGDTGRAATGMDASSAGTDAEAAAGRTAREPWEKPDDWWRRMPQ